MDFHIDKKMGLLLLGTFILGGFIGSLAGFTAGHHGRSFSDGRGRGDYGMMKAGRAGGNFGQDDGALVQQIRMRRNLQQNRIEANAQIELAPSVAPSAAPVEVAPFQ